MKKIVFLIVIIATTVAWSCQKAKTIKEQKTLLFENNNKSDEFDPTETLEFKVIFDTVHAKGIINNKSLWPTLKLWRKKGGCKKIGICTAHWKKNDEYQFVGREVNVPIIYNSKTGIFSKVRLEFTSSPLFLDEDVIKFYIDDNFDFDVTPEMNLPFSIIRIEKGVIEYDETIGIFGGYELSFVGIK